MKFTHLHLHTGYSLLDGAGDVRKMVKRAKELGMESIAITDHGVMYGVIEFYEAALSEGIKPILGCEVYVAPGSRFEKNSSMGESRYNHLVLLAENITGYYNLIKIVSTGFTEGFYYKPRVDHEILERYHEGIIATSACLAGEVPRALIMGNYDDAKQRALELERIFGRGNFFLELQDHGLQEQKRVNPLLIKMSEETGIELICTNDVHYINAEDADPHDILLCIQTGKNIDDPDRMRYEGGQFYLKSPEEMEEIFGYIPRAIENTQKIADRCNVEIKFHEKKLPKFDCPDGLSSKEYLRRLCEEGLKKRYDFDERSDEKIIRDRLEHELGIIENMGFVDYFLIVWDYVEFAKKSNIPVGPGRGSAAGSIVSYCLGITDICPIEYNLIFERFLNPERVTMPDIDIDFCDERRQEVIDYVMQRYGNDYVARIISFTTMAARAAIKDVGRAFNISLSKTDMIAKTVPQTPGMTIEKALVQSVELKRIYDNDPEAKDLIDNAMLLEGLPRHTNIHPAGVLICDRHVDEYVPVDLGENGENVSEYIMTTLENLGLLKMDILSLRTLSVIRDAIDMIRARGGEYADFCLEDININDSEVFDYISTGRCDGMFQLESAGMKSFMKELKPTNIEELIAGISLYRPGPMDFIPLYIKGKNNPDEVKYECEELRHILAPTYGCIVYQEQVMQIVRELAGYSWGRSDEVRRIMSKKKPEQMEKERRVFIYGDEDANIPGCINNGIPEKTAIKIFDEMADFASYAFNRSHAASYAMVSYQTAYLKTHFPVELMAALITSVIESKEKVSNYIYVCRQIGIGILPPDINKSMGGFAIEDGKIRFGLSAIKGLGKAAVPDIVTKRSEGGEYRTFNDFVRRLSGVIKKDSLESLIKSGALDCIGKNRRAMLMAAPSLMDGAAKKRKDAVTGQMSIEDMLMAAGGDDGEVAGEELPDVEDFDYSQKLDYEKKAIGVFVSGHPLDAEVNFWNKRKTASADDFVTDAETLLCRVRDGEHYTIGGVVTEIEERLSKAGNMMAFVKLDDMAGSVDCIIFTKIYLDNKAKLFSGAKIFIRGRASVDSSGAAKLIADRIVPFDEVPKKLWMRFSDEVTYLKNKEELKSLLKEENAQKKGRDIVIIYLEKERKMDRWAESETVSADAEVVSRLRRMYGEKNVEIT